MEETPSSSKDPKDILPKEKSTFQEKIKSWDISLLAQKKPLQDPNSTITEEELMDTTEQDAVQAKADAILNESDEMHDAASEIEKAEDAADAAEAAEGGADANEADDNGNNEDEATLRKKALKTMSKKRTREKTQDEINIEEALAKTKSEAAAKRAMIEMEATKSRRMLLYLPVKGANFKDIMTKWNCRVEDAYSNGEYKGMYKSLVLEREAQWDRGNKVGQIYQVAGADTTWLMKTLTEILDKTPVESYLYLYRDFIAEWDVAILLLNGSALVEMKYDREKVLSYLERNMGEVARLKRDSWRLISISQPRIGQVKLKKGKMYFDPEGKKMFADKEGLYEATLGNALTTLHIQRKVADEIRAKGGSISFQHGPVKIKWGNPEVVFKSDFGSSANATPLGPGKEKEKPKPNKNLADVADPRNGNYEIYKMAFDEYEAKWEQSLKPQLNTLVSKFKYLIENPLDEDDVSVVSCKTDISTRTAGSAKGLSKGQKKNLMLKKKSLCKRAYQMRQDRIDSLNNHRWKLSESYCPIALHDERNQTIVDIEAELKHQFERAGDPDSVIMEED